MAECFRKILKSFQTFHWENFKIISFREFSNSHNNFGFLVANTYVVGFCSTTVIENQRINDFKNRIVSILYEFISITFQTSLQVLKIVLFKILSERFCIRIQCTPKVWKLWKKRFLVQFSTNTLIRVGRKFFWTFRYLSVYMSHSIGAQHPIFYISRLYHRLQFWSFNQQFYFATYENYFWSVETALANSVHMGC